MTDEGDTAELSVHVVLLRGDLPGEAIPMYESADGDLLDSSTVLSAPLNVPRAIVQALLEIEVPFRFKEIPWLSEYRELIFVDGRCEVNGYELCYHEDFGVYANEEV